MGMDPSKLSYKSRKFKIYVMSRAKLIISLHPNPLEIQAKKICTLIPVSDFCLDEVHAKWDLFSSHRGETAWQSAIRLVNYRAS